MPSSSRKLASVPGSLFPSPGTQVGVQPLGGCARRGDRAASPARRSTKFLEEGRILKPLGMKDKRARAFLGPPKKAGADRGKAFHCRSGTRRQPVKLHGNPPGRPSCSPAAAGQWFSTRRADYLRFTADDAQRRRAQTGGGRILS